VEDTHLKKLPKNSMDKERDQEFWEEQREDADESGFSEKQMDLDMEVQAGEWQNLKRFKTYRNRSRQGKIIATYQAVSNRLNQMVAIYYRLVGKNPKQGEKMLQELRNLRLIQEILLNCMVWEPKGQLEKDMVPSEVWNLIK